MKTQVVAILLSALPSASGMAAQDGEARAKARGAGPFCVQRMLVESPVVRDDGQVLFRGQPDVRRSYVAEFKGRACPGLNRFASVIVEPQGASYCEGDRVRVIIAPVTSPGSVCVIDRLVPVDASAVK